MTNAQKVNMALAYKGMSKTDLAKAINTSVQNLSQKLARDTLSTQELEQIAAAHTAQEKAHRKRCALLLPYFLLKIHNARKTA